LCEYGLQAVAAGPCLRYAGRGGGGLAHRQFQFCLPTGDRTPGRAPRRSPAPPCAARRWQRARHRDVQPAGRRMARSRTAPEPPTATSSPSPMLSNFFYRLRAKGVPVSIQEYLTLMELLRSRVMPPTLDDFYEIGRMTLVKDETFYDRYDQVFSEFCRGLAAGRPDTPEVPQDWLVKNFEKTLTPEEKAALRKHGWDALMALFKERMQE